MHETIILMVEGKGYVKEGENLSYQFTTSPLQARKFNPADVWHKEKELNVVKNDLDVAGLKYEEFVFKYEVYRR